MVSALGIRARWPRFDSRVAPLFHWVTTLGKLFTHIASPVSQLQETGCTKREFSWLWWLCAQDQTKLQAKLQSALQYNLTLLLCYHYWLQRTSYQRRTLSCKRGRFCPCRSFVVPAHPAQSSPRVLGVNGSISSTVWPRRCLAGARSLSSHNVVFLGGWSFDLCASRRGSTARKIASWLAAPETKCRTTERRSIVARSLVMARSFPSSSSHCYSFSFVSWRLMMWISRFVAICVIL